MGLINKNYNKTNSNSNPVVTEVGELLSELFDRLKSGATETWIF